MANRCEYRVRPPLGVVVTEAFGVKVGALRKDLFTVRKPPVPKVPILSSSTAKDVPPGHDEGKFNADSTLLF